MSTEAQQTGDGAAVAGERHAVGHRQPHGQDLRARDLRRHGPGDRPAPDQGLRGRLRPDDLRPGVHEHRVVPVGDHLHRRRQGDPRVPRLPDRAARRSTSTYLEVAYLLIHGELPTEQQLRRLGLRHHGPHVRPREREGLHAGVPPRRPPDGDAAGLGRRALDLLPRRQRHRRPREPDDADHPAHREDADAGRLRLPPLQRPALRLSRQRPEVPRQLPGDDVQDDRAEVRAGPPARAGARHPLHPPRRPRAELLDERRAQRRLLAGRSVLGGRRRRRRRSTARCTAAPTRRSCGC